MYKMHIFSKNSCITLLILLHGIYFTCHCSETHITIALLESCFIFKGRKGGLVGPKVQSLKFGTRDVRVFVFFIFEQTTDPTILISFFHCAVTDQPEETANILFYYEIHKMTVWSAPSIHKNIMLEVLPGKRLLC